MKKYVPFVVLSVFVILLLGLAWPILMKHQQEEAQRAYESGRHLVIFSDLPQDVNDGLAREFYKQKHLRVQIYSKTDSDCASRWGISTVLIRISSSLRKMICARKSKMAFSSRMSRPIPTISRRP